MGGEKRTNRSKNNGKNNGNRRSFDCVTRTVRELLRSG
jgi:hypothetical protein